MLIRTYTLFTTVYLTNLIKPIVTECKCGEVPNIETRIFGGKTVSPLKYPWMAYIQITKVLFCGGVVINDLYILTALHCVQQANGLNFDIYLHTIHRAKEKGDKYQPAEIVKFHDFKLLSSRRNDVVLIKVNRRIKFDGNTLPICLPNPESKYTNLNVSVLGWGISAINIASNSLQLANLTIMSDKYCKRSAIWKHYNSELMLCAYAKGRDACKGDSGGPLIYNSNVNSSPKYELVGLVSSGLKCGIGAPGMYAKITMYLDWIISKTKDAHYCSY